jgi:hypothetical protein
MCFISSGEKNVKEKTFTVVHSMLTKHLQKVHGHKSFFNLAYALIYYAKGSILWTPFIITMAMSQSHHIIFKYGRGFVIPSARTEYRICIQS